MPKPIWPLQWQLGKEVEHNAFVKFLLKSFSLILEHNLENEAVLISKGSFVYLLLCLMLMPLIDSENLAFEIFEDCHCCRISS